MAPLQTNPGTRVLPEPLPRPSRLQRGFDAVVIGGSFGALDSLSRLVAPLPADFPVPIIAVQHLGSTKTYVPQILARKTRLPVKLAADGERFRPETIYIAPPGVHLQVGVGGRCRLGEGARVSHARPSADVLLETAAECFKSRTLAVILTGFLSDGTAGAMAVHGKGGVVIVQDPATCAAPGMPASVIEHGYADLVLAPEKIADALVSLAMVPGTRELFGFQGSA